MADEEPQGQEATSWWAVDAFAEASLPAATFDEPLVWPDALAWDDPALPAPLPGKEAIPEVDLNASGIFSPEPEIAAPVEADVAPGAVPPPPSDLEWQDAGADPEATMVHVEALGGLGGGAAPTPAGPPPPPEPLLESIWAALPPPKAGDELLVTTTIPAPTVFAMTGGGLGAPPPSRGSSRRGNIAVVALISLASLVLLGMFLSVRNRDEVPTDASQPRTPSDEIAVTGALNTIPLNTTMTTPATTPATTPGINIGDLVPPTDTVGTPTGGGATATTAPARSTTPSAGGSTATPTTQPAPATTVAPAPTPTATTAPTVSFPPVDNTTSAATPRRTVPSVTIPTFPTSSVPTNTNPSFTIPTYTIPSPPGQGG